MRAMAAFAMAFFSYRLSGGLPLLPGKAVFRISARTSQNDFRDLFIPSAEVMRTLHRDCFSKVPVDPPAEAFRFFFSVGDHASADLQELNLRMQVRL